MGREAHWKEIGAAEPSLTPHPHSTDGQGVSDNSVTDGSTPRNFSSLTSDSIFIRFVNICEGSADEHIAAAR